MQNRLRLTVYTHACCVEYNSMQQRLMQGAQQHNARQRRAHHVDDDTDQFNDEIRQRDREAGKRIVITYELVQEASETSFCFKWFKYEYPAQLLLDNCPGLLGNDSDSRTVPEAKRYLQAENTRERFMREWRARTMQMTTETNQNQLVYDLERKAHDYYYDRNPFGLQEMCKNMAKLALCPPHHEAVNSRLLKTMMRISHAPSEHFLVPLPDRAKLVEQQWDWTKKVKATDWEYVVTYLAEYLDSLYEAIGEHMRG